MRDASRLLRTESICVWRRTHLVLCGIARILRDSPRILSDSGKNDWLWAGTTTAKRTVARCKQRIQSRSPVRLSLQGQHANETTRNYCSCFDCHRAAIYAGTRCQLAGHLRSIGPYCCGRFARCVAGESRTLAAGDSFSFQCRRSVMRSRFILPISQSQNEDDLAEQSKEQKREQRAKAQERGRDGSAENPFAKPR